MVFPAHNAYDAALGTSRGPRFRARGCAGGVVVCYSTGMSERGVRCGKCKERHPSVADVRECYRRAASAPAQVGQEAPAEPAPTEPGFYSTGPHTYRLAPRRGVVQAPE